MSVRQQVPNLLEVCKRVVVCEYSITALRIGVLLAVLLAPLAAQTKSHTKATSSNPKTETFVLPDEPAFDVLEPSTDPELRKWQIENLRAQTEYYQRRPALLERLAPWASGLAALVAFVTLIVNYRSNTQSQRDTKFYEALKRFGDKDSPSVRVSATLLLSEMAQRAPTLGFAFRRKRTEYLPTVLNQLVVGMLLEQNPVALESIRAVFFELAHLNRNLSASLLFNQNRSLAANLVEAFVAYISANGVSNLTDITPEAWGLISTATGFSREAFEGLLLNFNGRYSTASVSKFDELLKRTASRYPSMADDEHVRRMKKLDSRLRHVSNLMRSNIQTCSRASTDLFNSKTWAGGLFLPRSNLFFRSREKINMQELSGQNAEISGMAVSISLPYSDLRGSLFQGGNLSESYIKRTDLRDSWFRGSNLRQSHLQETDLRGAKLFDVDLQGAHLAGAKIDNYTQVRNTKWWQADFYKDTELIARFFDSWYDKKELIKDPARIDIILTESHPSARPTLENLLKSYLARTT